MKDEEADAATKIRPEATTVVKHGDDSAAGASKRKACSSAGPDTVAKQRLRVD